MAAAARRDPTYILRLVGRLLELQLVMVFGASACYVLGGLVPAASSAAAIYHPGTYLFAIGDVAFLALPVAAWNIGRGRGWPHALEMALAMLTPVAAIALLGELAGYPYLLWLVTGMYPAMSVGMVFHLLYRRERVMAAARAMSDDARDG